MPVDLANVVVGKFLEFFFSVLDLVFRRAAVVGVFFDLLHCVAAHVPDSYTAVFGHFANDFDELVAAFLAQFRKEETDGFALD